MMPFPTLSIPTFCFTPPGSTHPLPPRFSDSSSEHNKPKAEAKDSRKRLRKDDADHHPLIGSADDSDESDGGSGAASADGSKAGGSAVPKRVRGGGVTKKPAANTPSKRPATNKKPAKAWFAQLKRTFTRYQLMYFHS